MLATSDGLSPLSEKNTKMAKGAAEIVKEHGVIAEVEPGAAGGNEGEGKSYKTSRINFDDVKCPRDEMGADVSVAVTGNVYGNHFASFESCPDASEETYKKANILSASYGGMGTSDE